MVKKEVEMLDVDRIIRIEFSLGQAVKLGFGFGLGLFLLGIMPWVIFLVFTGLFVWQ